MSEHTPTDAWGTILTTDVTDDYQLGYEDGYDEGFEASRIATLAEVSGIIAALFVANADAESAE